jgi:hypothetical protein
MLLTTAARRTGERARHIWKLVEPRREQIVERCDRNYRLAFDAQRLGCPPQLVLKTFLQAFLTIPDLNHATPQ